MSKPILTQERLKELLSYNPETGVFVWVRRKKNVAGHVRKDGYKQIQIGNTKFFSHRLAWLYMVGAFPLEQIDHINRARADNRFANLRAVTNSENLHNMGLKSTNKSGFKGVSYQTDAKKWRADISINSTNKYLGYFHTPEEASIAYLAAQKIYHPTCPTI